ncbi:MAG: TIGR02450 family Trp-rich protein [Synechococcales cyanobacterium RU_4_20]|nr:TIGR02450 family Trp-rich protein [Synechococcales cyanobacterium RU_4_20]NJR70836.1 TIGR02450 family Trp-rich protein [Synechococcales cyanobacterium CRU_2_2]
MAKKQRYPHLLGSKWTAQQKTLGWRHFQVTNRKNQGPWVYAELVASCDQAVRLWINAQLLKERDLWLPGWKSVAEIWEEDPADSS